KDQKTALIDDQWQVPLASPRTPAAAAIARRQAPAGAGEKQGGQGWQLRGRRTKPGAGVGTVGRGAAQARRASQILPAGAAIGSVLDQLQRDWLIVGQGSVEQVRGRGGSRGQFGERSTLPGLGRRQVRQPAAALEFAQKQKTLAGFQRSIGAAPLEQFAD